MHLYALMPVMAILVSAAFGAAAVAWDSGRRSTLSMCSIFGCTGFWALLDLMTYVDPPHAEFWIRWMPLPVFLLGPSGAWILSRLFPPLQVRLVRLGRIGFIAAMGIGVWVALWPTSILAVVPTDWGSAVPRYGILPIVTIPLASVLPLVSAVAVSRLDLGRAPASVDASRVRAIRVVIGVSLVVTITTEYLMPLLEIPAPRFGAVAMAFVSALMWLRVRRVADRLGMSADSLAQAMLDELHDGVVLVDFDGSILAASRRFAQMVGLLPADLTGSSLASCVEARMDELREALEDRKTVLIRSDGETLPVSISSSIAHDHQGDAQGVVVVVRDLREIDALQRRLLTSGRLAAIGELAAGIAHEINNPVAFIRSDLNLLRQRLDEIAVCTRSRGEEAEESVVVRTRGRIARALEGVERVAQVVGDVRSFAHVGGAGQGGSDPAVLVEGAMRLARLRRGDDVELRIVPGRCQAWVESGQELKQILLALALVLVEGSEKGGRIDAALEAEGDALHVMLSAHQLTCEPGEMIRRFERLSEGTLAASHSDFGLSVTAELMNQLNASFSLVETGPRGVRISIRLPLASGSD